MFSNLRFMTLRKRLADRTPNPIPDWSILGDLREIVAWDCRAKLIEHPMFPDPFRRCQATESFRAISPAEYGCLVTAGLALKDFLESEVELLLLLEEDVIVKSDADSYRQYIEAVSTWLLEEQSPRRALSYPCSKNPPTQNKNSFQISRKGRSNWGSYWVLLNRAAANVWLERVARPDFQYRPDDKLFLEMQVQGVLKTAHPLKLLVAHDDSRASTLHRTRSLARRQGKLRLDSRTS